MSGEGADRIRLRQLRVRDGLDDAWAAFTVEVASYAWLSEEGKRARFLALLGGLEAIEADVQILRVGMRWEPSDTCSSGRERANVPRAAAGIPRTAHARARRRYVQEHARA